MNSSPVPEEFLRNIFAEAEREYPKECCGMILGPRQKKGVLSRLRPCANAQDDYHARDPQNFPRTAETAYFMEPKELLAIQKEARTHEEEIRIIYHSHVDADAYFSEEDARIALAEGGPVYPDVDYLVVSVRKGKAAGCNLFRWDTQRKGFYP